MEVMISPTAGYKMMSVSDLVKLGATPSPGKTPKKGPKTPSNGTGSGSPSSPKKGQETKTSSSRLTKSLADAAATPPSNQQPQQPAPAHQQPADPAAAVVTPTTAAVIKAAVAQQAASNTAELIKVHTEYQQIMQAKDQDYQNAMALLRAKELELAEAKAEAEAVQLAEARIGYENDFPEGLGDTNAAQKKKGAGRAGAQVTRRTAGRGARN